jgi:integrase
MAEKLNLTEERVKRLYPEGSRERVVYDVDTPGFGVRCYPSGRKVYFFWYRAGRGAKAPKRRIKIGLAGAVTLSDARKKARGYIGDLANGEDPRKKEQRQERQHKTRLDNALEDYAASLEARKVVNHATIKRTLKRGLQTPFGKIELNDIDRYMVVEQIEKLEADGKPGAAQDLRAKAVAFFNWAANRGLMQVNPLAGLRRERRTRAQVTGRAGRVVEDDELKAIWKACAQAKKPYGDYVRLLILTGQRRKETAMMRWQDLDLEANVWTIPGDTAKNGREHCVPLPTSAVQVLERQKKVEGCGYVFVGRGKRPLTGWSKRHPELVKAAGVVFTLHDLRRTFRSGLTRLGVDSDLAEMMLNHARADLLEIYDRDPRREARKKAATRWATHIAGLVGEQPTGEVVELRRPA